MPRARSVPGLFFGLGLMAGCYASPASVTPVRATPARKQSTESIERCRPFAGTPGDPDLGGGSRSHAVRCCPSDYGFDPELARSSCGFADYLGESEELACVHRFADMDGRVHELRLTPILDLEFEDAIALHESGEFGSEHFGEARSGQPEIWWSAEQGRHWALVSGWSMVRRVGWDDVACDPERMQPVLGRMLDAREDREAAVLLPRSIDETPAPSLPSASLVTRSFEPRPSDRRYPLPRKAEQLVHDLLGAAVAEDLAGLTDLLEPGARIGLPDRRQLGARAIVDGTGAAAAARQLLDGAVRFPSTSILRCPEIDRRAKPRVTRGEALMWCFWISEDGLDLLTFGLRGRVVDDQADARVAYVGVFPVRPEAPLVIPGEPPPPPVVPTPELVCGDPHASSHPDVCPEPEPDAP